MTFQKVAWDSDRGQASCSSPSYSKSSLERQLLGPQRQAPWFLSVWMGERLSLFEPSVSSAQRSTPG